MTALPNMPTREEVEGAIASFNHECVVGHHTEVLLNAARAYLMLDAAHKGNVGTIEHFTNLLNEEKAKRAEAEEIKSAEKKILIEEVAKNKDLREQLLAAELQVARLREALQISAVDRENCEQWGIDFSKHKCDCDVCAVTTRLCPATQSSIIQEIQARVLNSTPPTDVLERVRKMARTLDAIKAHQHLEIHSCPCAFMLDEALEQAKEMGLV